KERERKREREREKENPPFAKLIYSTVYRQPEELIQRRCKRCICFSLGDYTERKPRERKEGGRERESKREGVREREKRTRKGEREREERREEGRSEKERENRDRQM